jgi:hypothetical protein
MSDKSVSGGDVLSGDELKRRWMAIARSIEAMGVEAGKLLGALAPDYLPEAVLRDIEAKTRPFTAAIREMTAECVGFQEYAKQFEEFVATRQRNADYEAFWAKPDVGEAIN